MSAFITALLSGIPTLLGKGVDLLLTMLGLKNQAPIVHGKQTEIVVTDDKKNADDVEKAIESGDVSVLQDKGNVK